MERNRLTLFPCRYCLDQGHAASTLRLKIYRYSWRFGGGIRWYTGGIRVVFTCKLFFILPSQLSKSLKLISIQFKIIFVFTTYGWMTVALSQRYHSQS